MGHAVLHSGFCGDPQFTVEVKWGEKNLSATENGCYSVKAIYLEV